MADDKEHLPDVLALNEETKPGLPPPVEVGYEPDETRLAAERTQAKEDAGRNRYALEDPVAKRTKRRESQPTPAASRKRNKRTRLDNELTEADYQLVFDAFSNTGDVDNLVELTGLSRDKVDHLLNIGLMRLQLPGIKDAAINRSKLHRDLARVRREDAAALQKPDTQEAIQERVTQEAAMVQRGIDLAVSGNEFLTSYAEKLQEALKQNLLVMPEVVTPELLKHFVQVLETHSRTIERLVKLQKLNAGEPTDIVGHQIVALLAGCTTDELKHAAKTGTLPSLARAEAQRKEDEDDDSNNLDVIGDAIDVEFEEE